MIADPRQLLIQFSTPELTPELAHRLNINRAFGSFLFANALAAFLKHRGRDGELVMLSALNAFQGERYVYLCEKREKNEDSVFGWFLHRVVI